MWVSSFPRRVAVLRYHFAPRRLPAAVVSLAFCAGAAAGTIDGTVTFPGEQVPSMTVYASDVETSRVHSVRLARGQTAFTVEVPAGRYLVFLAPNEPGAPNVYGAYTEYSLCAPHDADGKCEDHALVPVVINARTAHGTVTIDDWYLSDDIAGQIDRIRGAAASFYSEPLSAPRFSEYPSASFDISTAPKVDLASTELSEENRALLRQSLASGPNFAGHVSVTLTRCGPACGRLVLIDWRNGAVQELASPHPPGDIQGTLPCRGEEALLIRRDSRLLSVTRERGAAVVTQYYVWNPKNAALVFSAEYQRSAQTFCSIAAH
jgi:hypothetical protein